MFSILIIILSIAFGFVIHRSAMTIHKKSNIGFEKLVKFVSAPLSLAISIVTIFVIVPLHTPVVTMTNDTKTIEFYGMQHLGKESFYSKIATNIKNARKAGYTIVYEGVGLKDVQLPTEPCIIESKNIFGTMKQPLCMGDIQNTDIIADMTREEYLNALAKSAIERGHDKETAKDSVLEASKTLSGLMNKELYDNLMSHILIKTVLLNSSPEMLVHSSEMSLAEYKPEEKEVEAFTDLSKLEGLERKSKMIKEYIDNRVIIDERNKIVVKAINESKSNNILITYGREHMYGILEILQQQDPNWKIVDKKLIVAM